MSEQRTGALSRRRLLHLGGAAAVTGLAGCTGGSTDGGSGDGGSSPDDTASVTEGDSSATSENTETGTTNDEGSLTIFHAGSLAPPFSAAEPKFEKKYDTTVNREAKGSVASTQKITEQGRTAGVLGVSDFRLIRDRVLPDYGDWYTIFTTNAMSIQYREDSPGADEISTDNWWEVLSRDDVVIGHSDPAVDPGGYRSVMTMQLGKTAFDGEKLYDDATYQKLRDNSTVPTGTETNLEGQLKSGKLDYVFYYQSISSTSELPWVKLQPEVDLSKATAKYAKHYAKAKVETDSGSFTGAPIAYGMTVPSVTETPELGAKWVEYMASDAGQQTLKDKGLQPVSPIVVPKSGEDAVPDRVMDVAEAKSSLGPLEL
ncbi:molybdate/tungstate transport system substrate-binding protein [Halogranum rubrum]|uniref:Molybdate/tungstate transport system substrate-binding protein n=1 Tax=Halogranum rubrum TaxID=553466 RepID=A0A1I4AXY1_9EURY|nr:extracellular solute-binding protein [Halogranum rubrum]SFK61153.1 molybdate/tungstate transport system substrate-binding protein [Halogranum rubrum]